MLRRIAVALALTLVTTAPVCAQTAVDRAEADYLAATPLPVDAREEAREWRLWWSESAPTERPAMEAERIAGLERATARDRGRRCDSAARRYGVGEAGPQPLLATTPDRW